MEKIILKNRKGQKIVGMLEKPETEVMGTCVIQHGWSSSKESTSIQSLKNGFLKSGFQTFNFDATNSFNESDGDFEKSTLGLHWEDFEDVTKWVQEQSWFKGKLAVAGHSKGGYSCIRYAEEYPEEVKLAVSLAPVVSGKLSFETQRERDLEGFIKFEQEGSIPYSKSNGIKSTKHWFQMEERLNHDLLEKVSNINMPVLVIVGSKDESCPPKHVKDILFEAMPSDKKYYIEIEDAPHFFKENWMTEKITSEVSNWVTNIYKNNL